MTKPLTADETLNEAIEMISKLRVKSIKQPINERELYDVANLICKAQDLLASQYKQEPETKNIYTVLGKIGFEKQVSDFVALNEKGAELGKDKMYVQNFVFGIVQKFYEQTHFSSPQPKVSAAEPTKWNRIANNILPEEEGRYWVLDKYGSKECCLYGNSGAPNENTYFFDGENVKAKDIIAWSPKEEYLLLNAEGFDTSKVNRVEVIDEKGRQYVKWKDGIKVEISMQDDNRTLKVFVSPPNT